MSVLEYALGLILTIIVIIVAYQVGKRSGADLAQEYALKRAARTADFLVPDHPEVSYEIRELKKLRSLSEP